MCPFLVVLFSDIYYNQNNSNIMFFIEISNTLSHIHSIASSLYTCNMVERFSVSYSPHIVHDHLLEKRSLCKKSKTKKMNSDRFLRVRFTMCSVFRAKNHLFSRSCQRASSVIHWQQVLMSFSIPYKMIWILEVHAQQPNK